MIRRPRYQLISSGILLLCTMLFAQTMIQPRKLIDCHTAGVLPRAVFDLEARIYPNGDTRDTTTQGAGMMLGIDVGITNYLNIGVSYGGDGIIGRNAPRFNPHLGAMIKFRIVEESYVWPAIALGYDHQGYGGIDASYNGYVFKSPGFFVAASKNYLFFNTVQLGLHGGLNYSLEEWEDIRWPNLYVGLDLGFNETFALMAEYNTALNYAQARGNTNPHHNPLQGFLNIGFRWAFSQSFYIEVCAKDILQNKVVEYPIPVLNTIGREAMGWSREVKLVYVEKF